MKKKVYFSFEWRKWKNCWLVARQLFHSTSWMEPLQLVMVVLPRATHQFFLFPSFLLVQSIISSFFSLLLIKENKRRWAGWCGAQEEEKPNWTEMKEELFFRNEMWRRERSLRLITHLIKEKKPAKPLHKNKLNFISFVFLPLPLGRGALPFINTVPLRGRKQIK